MSETAISLVSNNVPAHVKEASGLGNENVTAEHLQTPRVKLLQQMNSEVDLTVKRIIANDRKGDQIVELISTNDRKVDLIAELISANEQ